MTHAISVLSDPSRSCKVIAGGTDVLVGIRQGIYAPERLLDLSRVPGMRDVKLSENELLVGAGLTLTELISHQTIREHVPGLSRGAALIATQQIRNRATVAGDLCQEKRCWFFRSAIPCYRFAGPACPCYAVTNDNRHHSILGAGRCAAPCVSDLAPMFSALEAEAVVLSSQGERRIRIEKFYRWAGEPCLKANECITAIAVPLTSCAPSSLVYEKFARWTGDFAEASVAICTTVVDGKVAECRVALGGVSPYPARVPRVERSLMGKTGREIRAELPRITEETIRGALPLDRNGYKARLLVGIASKAIERTLAPLPV